MNNRITVLLAGLTLAGSVHGGLVAGWDFSQYLADGITSIDGSTYATTLPANYSDLDPNGAGTVAATRGTLFYDGQKTSSNLNPATEVLPITGNLANNADASAFGLTFGSPGSYSVLSFEGQQFTNDLSLGLTTNGSIVFAATPGGTYSDWGIAFSGRTSDSSVSFDILFSTDGGSYTSIAAAQTMNTLDSLFSYSVPGTPATEAYWKISFSGVAGFAAPVIDNVGITAVPEPSTIALSMGIIALAVILRRRFP